MLLVVCTEIESIRGRNNWRTKRRLPFVLSPLSIFRNPLPFSLFPSSLLSRLRVFNGYIYIYIYAPFDNSLADDTTRQVPRSATDQYAFTIAAWNDNYCYTRDNSRRCPSVGIRVYCARRRKETCRGREREREEEEANYRVVYNTVHCILLTSTY